METLERQASRPPEKEDDRERNAGLDESEEIGTSAPAGAAVQSLRDKFLRFVQRLTPPDGARAYRDFVGWLETLIGPDPDALSPASDQPDEPTALQVVAQVRQAPEPLAERDIAALRLLKDILRGLVWAEDSVGTPEHVTYRQFVDELAGAIEAAVYQLPLHANREEIIVTDVVQARGISLRAVAVLGLAEGEFPPAINEDPILRDIDRRRLREGHNLPLEPSIESAEQEFFYETVTRPRERLLLTRPRLADNGALWPPSHFWEEVERLVNVQPRTLTSDSLPTQAEAASWPEWVESLAARADADTLQVRLADSPERFDALERAVHVVDARRRDAGGSPFDGDLSSMSEHFSERFGRRYVWSSSQLEAYHACPFRLFVTRVLGLEPRTEPAEGLDAAQLGNIYHHIFERLYRDSDIADPGDLDQLLDALPRVAAAVLDAAPQDEGFQETAWWPQTRDEICDNVRRSLDALHQLPGEFIPYRQEASFGLGGKPALELSTRR